MSFLYRIQDLRYERKDGTPFEFTVEHFTIGAGGIVAIIGSSGSGKTTFINLLSGLARPTCKSYSIELLLGGERHLFSATQPGRFPERGVGRVFQHGHLLPSATVAANVAVAAHAAGVEYSRAMLEQALVHVGLDGAYLDRRAWQLSGGEAQRVSIARAMIAGPQVIFADEPTSNVDPDLEVELMELFQKWTKNGSTERTILWVTHNYGLAARFAETVVVLTAGSGSKGEKKAGVLGNETEPRDNPGTRDELHDWVRSAPANLARISHRGYGERPLLMA